MGNPPRYGGLDAFKVIAALLVVAIHTSPLTTYSPDGDFLLTRSLARVAVPGRGSPGPAALFRPVAAGEENSPALPGGGGALPPCGALRRPLPGALPPVRPPSVTLRRTWKPAS